jgi:hypothetical protein
MHTIEKKQLVQEPIAPETHKLAEAIYSTYLTNKKDSYMLIPMSRFYNLFGLEQSAASLEKIVDIFIDLTEPILIEDFEFRAKRYPNIILTFCDFKIIKQEDDMFIEIELSEMYLEALKKYILNPYLEIK